jgi:hypothetical protein
MTEKSLVDLIKEEGASFEPADIETPKKPSVEEIRSFQIQETTSDVDLIKHLLRNVKPVSEIEVELPSNGSCYDRYGVVNGKVRVSPLTLEEEINFATELQNGGSLYSFIHSILKNKIKGINDVRMLTIPDMNFLLFKLREISFGNQYPIEHNCSKCKHINQIYLDLATVPVKKGNINSLYGTFTFPEAKIECKYRLIVFGDQEQMKESKDFIKNLHKYVIELDGKKQDSKIVYEVLKSLPNIDLTELLKNIMFANYGLERIFKYNCKKCETENKAEIDLNEHFFTSTPKQS